MGNCLRLGISRIGLAWSKWRMSAKFKRKNVSIIILGMQAVGKTTIALRLYKFKRALPDTNYVQTKGFNTYTVKKNKTTVNIYDLGGHPSIQELWDHYYADSHGVVFVVDTSQRETVPEAGQLLCQVLSDHRIRGKPVLLLANKIDLDGVTETELDSMMNLQHLVNSVRCLTRLDISCATDLKNDKGIFEGFKWLISYIESNFHDLNTRVLSDTLEEKNREKARREAVRAAREADRLAEENAQLEALGSPLAASTPVNGDGSGSHRGSIQNNVETMESQAKSPAENCLENSLSQPSSAGTTSQHSTSVARSPRKSATERPGTHLEAPSDSSNSAPRPISVTRLPPEPVPTPKIPVPLLPPIATPFVDQPIKLPRLKSPKSRPEIINRIEDTGISVVGSKASTFQAYPPVPGSDQYYDEKGFRFRKISTAQRLSPEGADSDDGIVNMAYEPSEDLSSDSTPIGVRKHNFNGNNVDGDLPNREIFMITTMAEVHKEYFKDRKGSTSTHDSVSMSVASLMSDTADIGTLAAASLEDGQSAHTSLQNGHPESTGELTTAESTPNKKSLPGGKPKSKKRLNALKNRNKTAPAQDSPLKFASPLPSLPSNDTFSAKSTLENVASSSSNKLPFSMNNAWGSTEAKNIPGGTSETGKF